jgi:6-phosphogluconolactonase
MLNRRSFLLSLPAAALALRTPSLFAAPPAGRIFVGTTGHVSKGIYMASWNPATGEIGALTLAAEVPSPTFLATSGNHLYACSETNGASAKASAYTITPAGLTKLDDQPSLGGGTTFISVKGNSVFVANYGGGSVTSYHIEPDGSLSKPVSHFQFEGSGPNKERQDHSHAHSALASPDGRFLLVNDLGLDRIVIYRIDPATSTLTPNDPPFFTTRPGVGPRHLAWHPNGKWLYSVNELDSTVDQLTWNSATGTLTQGPFVSTLEPNFSPNTAFAGEIQISPDGRFLYVANRVASDTIAVLSINRKSGALHLEQDAPNGGQNTRFFALDPTGRWLLLCNQASNALVVLRRDPHTGKLSAPVHSYPIDKPQCLVFSR